MKFPSYGLDSARHVSRRALGVHGVGARREELLMTQHVRCQSMSALATVWEVKVLIL